MSVQHYNDNAINDELCEQLPTSPIHWLRWHEKYHVSCVSLQRIITLSPMRWIHAFSGTWRSGQPITALRTTFILL